MGRLRTTLALLLFACAWCAPATSALAQVDCQAIMNRLMSGMGGPGNYSGGAEELANIYNTYCLGGGQPQQSYSGCPANTQQCGNLCCGGGNVCSRHGCIPQEAADCGNYWCNPGQKCAINGRGCFSQDVVDCGEYSCGSDRKCALGWRGCLQQDDVDCGPRLRESCPAGSRCWVAPGDIPGSVVKGKLYCPKPSDVAEMEGKIREIAEEKRRVAEEARRAKIEAERRAKEEREAKAKAEREQREAKAKAEREQREATAKAKAEEAKRAQEAKAAAERARQDAIKAEAQRKKEDAERKLAEQRQKAQAERERMIAEKAAREQMAKQDKDLEALARNRNETVAARSIAAIALGKEPSTFGIPQTQRPATPPLKPSAAEREIALIALGKSSGPQPKPGSAPMSSPTGQLRAILEDPKESPTAKRIAEIALREEARKRAEAPIIETSPRPSVPAAGGTTPPQQSASTEPRPTTQQALPQSSSRQPISSLPTSPLRPSPQTTQPAPTAVTQPTPTNASGDGPRTRYTSLSDGRVRVQEPGKPPVDVSPQVAASQYGYRPQTASVEPRPTTPAPMSQSTFGNPTPTSTRNSPVPDAGSPFAVAGKSASTSLYAMSTTMSLADDAKMTSAISGKLLVGAGGTNAGRLLQSPQWSAQMQSPVIKGIAPTLGAMQSSVDLYRTYKSGDKLGTVIGSVSTANAIADIGGKSIKGVGTVTSLARDSQALGTAWGTGDKWTLDKGLQVGAAGSLLVGKSAAAGAAYLTFNAVGGPAAGLRAADVTTSTIDTGMALQAKGFDKLSDTQIFKRLTNSMLHIKDSDEAGRRADELRAQLLAKRQQQ